MFTDDPSFWLELDVLCRDCEIVVDRPRGRSHPHFPQLIYPRDYGYLQGTSGGDGAEIDVWLGESGDRQVTAVACSVDPYKRDAELKLFVGCTQAELELISRWLRVEAELPHLLIARQLAGA